MEVERRKKVANYSKIIGEARQQQEKKKKLNLKAAEPQEERITVLCSAVLHEDNGKGSDGTCCGGEDVANLNLGTCAQTSQESIA